MNAYLFKNLQWFFFKFGCLDGGYFCIFAWNCLKARPYVILRRIVQMLCACVLALGDVEKKRTTSYSKLESSMALLSLRHSSEYSDCSLLARYITHCLTWRGRKFMESCHTKYATHGQIWPTSIPRNRISTAPIGHRCRQFYTWTLTCQGRRSALARCRRNSTTIYQAIPEDHWAAGRHAASSWWLPFSAAVKHWEINKNSYSCGSGDRI